MKNFEIGKLQEDIEKLKLSSTKINKINENSQAIEFENRSLLKKASEFE